MKKVLIVGAIKSAIEEKRRILSNRGLMVFTAVSGEDARAVHEREKVDLIVADLDMSGMSGDKLCSLVRNDASLKSVSFIIICRDTRSALDRCASCGANAYITEPLDPVLFLEKLSSLIHVSKRSAMRVLLKVSVKGNLKSQGFFCTSVNVSTSGILLQSDKIISKGAVINCSFFLPRAQIISADCEVTRVAEVSPGLYQYGAKFLRLPTHYKASIDDFVKRKTD
ncbi:MAG TPA: response regulator [Thermodesulfovibrionales bacterium]|nr:response regulator [Thermodesulfovibrionales bacterium]